MQMYAKIVALVCVAAVVSAQTQRLIINSFNNGPSTAAINALGLGQGVNGAGFAVQSNRFVMTTQPSTPATFWTTLSSPQTGCIYMPPQQNIETFLVFRMQAPPGVDMMITMQSGTNGCQGAVNNTARVLLSNYNNLDGTLTWIRIPFTDFEANGYDYLNGRLRAVLIDVPALPMAARFQFDECQFVSRPRVAPLWGNPINNYGQVMSAGPPNGQWATIRADSRCGPGFNWAGCAQGQCCSSRGWCGTTPMHCLSLQGLLTNSMYQAQYGSQQYAAYSNGAY